MTNMVALAIGRSTHTIVLQNGDGFEQVLIPNSHSGAEKLLELNPKKLLMVGNRRWAMPMAYALRDGFEIRYVPKPTERGRRQDMAKFARVVLENNISGSPFFETKRPRVQSGKPEDHPWYQGALEYLTATNEVRRHKHNLLSTMAVLFPEAVRASAAEMKKKQPVPAPAPPDIWTKKMARVLENPDPHALMGTNSIPAEVKELAMKSLGLHLPPDLRSHYTTLHRENLMNYQSAVEQKEAASARLRELVQGHPIAKDFDGDVGQVLAALLGWREWPNWRELRSFAGLAVTRVDAKGKSRISRVRGEVRQYLYLMATRTTLGKELAGTAKKRVKRIEHLLKNLRFRYLKPSSLSVAA